MRSPRGPVGGAICAGIVVGVGALLKQKLEGSKKDKARASRRRRPAGVVVPDAGDGQAAAASAREEEQQPQEQPQQLLLPADSIKQPGSRPVLCLEVEAGPEEHKPNRITRAAMLRMQELLVACAVLGLCVAVDRLTSNAVTVTLLLTTGLAVFVAASIMQHGGEALTFLTSRIMARQQRMTSAGGAGVGTVRPQAKAAARTTLSRLEAEATSAAIAATYLPLAALASCSKLLSQLPSATAIAAAGYLKCLDAVAALGTESSGDDESAEQQERASASASKARVWPPLAEDAGEVCFDPSTEQPFAALRAVKRAVDCLHAITELGQEGSGVASLSEWLQDEPAAAAAATPSQAQRTEQRGSSGGWVQACAASVNNVKRLSSCFEAIAALGADERCAAAAVQEPQQPLVKDIASCSRSGSGSKCVGASGPDPTAIGTSTAFMHCMQAVAQLGGGSEA